MMKGKFSFMVPINSELILKLTPVDEAVSCERSCDWNARQLNMYLRPERILSERVLAAAVLQALAEHEAGTNKTHSLEHEIINAMNVEWELQKGLSHFLAEVGSPALRVSVHSTAGDESGDKNPSWNPDSAEIARYYKIDDAELALEGGLNAAILTRIAARYV